MAGLVKLKGKAVLENGRFRGNVREGESIHWTSEDQVVEVSEEVAREIESDPMIVVVRVDDSAPPAPPPAAAAPALPPGAIVVTKAEQEEVDRMISDARAEAEALKAELAALKAAAAASDAKAKK